MDADVSFADYVALRWSRLYRLAVLLVGTDRADELARTTLLRACASWRQVEQESSVDATVTKILVHGALARGRRRDRTEGDADPPDWPTQTGDAELWWRVEMMPPRERAVVVLLYHEQLSEREVSRLLGRSVRTVRAIAFAALSEYVGLTDHTTRELGAELAARADETEVPAPPDPLSLLPQARQYQRRRVRRSLAWTIAAGVAIVAVLAGAVDGGVLGGGDPARSVSAPPVQPGTLADLPRGGSPSIAYSVGRTLHVGDRELVLADPPSAIAQSPGRAFLSYGSGRIDQVDLADLTVKTLTRSAAGPAVADPEGELVAWLLRGTGAATVLVYSVGTGASDEQTFPVTPRCCDNPFEVHGITRSGQVVGALPAEDRAWVWDVREGGDPTEIEGIGTRGIVGVTADEVVVHDAPFHFAAGEVAGNRFRTRFQFQARSADFDDPRVRRVVYVDRAGETVVRDRINRRRDRRVGDLVRLRLPALDAGFRGAWWEDNDHVLLDVVDDVVPRGALVRCHVETGRCETAARFAGPHVLAR